MLKLTFSSPRGSFSEDSMLKNALWSFTFPSPVFTRALSCNNQSRFQLFTHFIIGGVIQFTPSSLRKKENVQGQISEHISAPNGDYRVYYPSNLLRNARSFENGGYSRISLSFSWGIFGYVTCLDQSRASEKI